MCGQESHTTTLGKTYAKWGLAAKNRAVLWVDNKLKLLHALGPVGQQRREHLLEGLLDGQRSPLERHLRVLHISDALGGFRNELVS